MARLAGELRRELSEALALLQPFPGRLEFAARLALICALTTLVVEVYQTPEAALTAYVAFFVMKRDRMESVVVSIVMTILISLIIGIVIPGSLFRVRLHRKSAASPAARAARSNRMSPRGEQ
jgi:multidrug resistance protein MdtO